jgi:thiosulfate/3-mercaptopyruvate sulfurtransferase
MTATNKNYQHPEYLVETDWLEQNLDDDNLRIIDCTVYVVPNPDLELGLQYPFIFDSGLDNFNKAHIPHAGYIDIANELSDESSDLPLMMPTEEQFSKVMSKFGITSDTRVILYSSTEQNWATRLWWMLRSCGFRNAAVLNGGWNKWFSENRPSSNSACEYVSTEFIIQSESDLFVGKEEVLSAIGDDKIRIINSLPSLLYTGNSDITFGRKGRITDSVNIPFVALQDSDTGVYLPANKLQELFDSVNVTDAEQMITYCGGGVAASNNAFALALLGYDNVAVYDGSMLEWGNDSQLPMELG